MTLSILGNYAVENISFPLASQADFSAAGHKRVPLANRIITEKIDSVMSKTLCDAVAPPGMEPWQIQSGSLSPWQF
jgi:hypothetical protein